MDFINYSNKLFKNILETDFSNVKLTSYDAFLSTLSLSGEAFSREAFQDYYRIEIESIINENLYPILESENKIKEIKENYFYDEGAPIYSLMYLFWIWHNDIKFSSSDLKKILQGIFMGTMGYRLIDMYSDDESSKRELLYLGNYLIRLFEKTFNNVLGLQYSYEAVNYYAMKYAEVEYKEKNNLWKNCPFTWEKVHALGYKTAPLISIFEALFKYTGIDDEKAKEITHALLHSLAANQLVDDVGDALSDLSVGRETLATAGFYEHYGYNKIYTQEQVDEYLTQERLFKVHDTRKSLLDKATEIYIKNGEEILLLWVQIAKLNRLSVFEFVDINS